MLARKVLAGSLRQIGNAIDTTAYISNDIDVIRDLNDYLLTGLEAAQIAKRPISLTLG